MMNCSPAVSERGPTPLAPFYYSSPEGGGPNAEGQQLCAAPTGRREYIPPKAAIASVSPHNTGSPSSVDGAPIDAEFDIGAYVEMAAQRGGLPVRSPQVLQAISILRSNGFLSQKLIEGLTEKIAIEYLKLPVVIWVCILGLQKESLEPQQQSSAGQKRALQMDEPEEPANAPIVKKSKKQSESPPSAATLRERIARYCQEIGHDPAFFLVKSNNAIHCLVCNKTFKLHRKGQITRVKRHINGEVKRGLSRHRHNVINFEKKLRAQHVVCQIPPHIRPSPVPLYPASPTAVPSVPGVPLLRPHPPVQPGPALVTTPSCSAATPLHSAVKSPIPVTPLCGLAQSLFHPFPSSPFSHAMAAVPTLQMLQATKIEKDTPDTKHEQDMDYKRKRLDNEYGRVHCHCLRLAKEVAVDIKEEDFVRNCKGADSNERRFYVCERRYEEDGCSFVRPKELVKVKTDGGVVVMDVPDELLESYIDGNSEQDDGTYSDSPTEDEEERQTVLKNEESDPLTAAGTLPEENPQVDDVGVSVEGITGEGSSFIEDMLAGGLNDVDPSLNDYQAIEHLSMRQ